MADRSSPRLKDVAAAAQVSLAAASRILRGDDTEFGLETCQRVLDAADRLGYRRNLLVDGVQTGRTKTIGVLIPPYDSGWADVLSGIHMTLASADYLPITVWIGDFRKVPACEHEEEEAARQINRLLGRRVDGLIMWPAFRLAYYDQFRELVERKVPVAIIEHESPTDNVIDSVETDERQLAHDAAAHLLELGHRRLACMSSREAPAQAWASRRRRYFEATVEECVDAQAKSWRLNLVGDNGLEVARQILSDPLDPTAVFAVTDHEALYVYQAAAELGWRIPEDLSVIGCADLDFAPFLNPPLTSMRQQQVEIGRRAALLVLDRLEGGREQSECTTIRISAELIERGSTGPPPENRV